MATPNARGKLQLSCYVDEWLYTLVARTAQEQGLNVSILLRRAVLRELGMNALGERAAGTQAASDGV